MGRAREEGKGEDLPSFIACYMDFSSAYGRTIFILCVHNQSFSYASSGLPSFAFARLRLIAKAV